MKIDNSTMQQQSIAAYRNELLEKAGAEGKQKGGAARPGGDQVEISLRRVELDKLKEQAALMPEQDRSSRVQEIRQQVAAGTYQVDTRLVAEKMLARFGKAGEKG